MNNHNSAIICRHFASTLALTAVVLVFGNALPAWAEKKKSQEKPSAPAPDDSTQQKYESKVLWEFDAMDAGQNKRSAVYGYKGNAYKIFILPGYKTMIAKIPLDGSEVQTASLGDVTNSDNHRYYDVAADSAGYIHVSGNMHSTPIVRHWISKNPEDISEFINTTGLGENKRPQGVHVTYPNFFKSPDGVLYHSIRCGDPVYGIGISVLDVKTQTWTVLGADIPAEVFKALGAGKKIKDSRGKPLTAWEENGEGGNFGYAQPRANIHWDKNKRMHLAFVLLNKNTATADTNKHTTTDVLYAYSDDGGKTFRRRDGSVIQMPMRAEPGPHQADVVYSRSEGPPPWVSINAGIAFDAKGRPVVKFRDYKTGPHSMVLENGKWSELVKSASDPTVKPQDDEEEDDADPVKLATLNLPHKILRLDPQYFHETGNLLYAAEVPKKLENSRIKIVLAKPVPPQKK